MEILAFEPIERACKDTCVAALANQRPALRGLLQPEKQPPGCAAVPGASPASNGRRRIRRHVPSAAATSIVVVQADEKRKASEVVSSNEVKKYVAVCKAM
jgi:hypothetical protein